MDPSCITTERLELVAGTHAILKAEQQGRPQLARLLHVPVPSAWPPPLYDKETIRYIERHLASRPDDAIWMTRYVILRQPAPVLIGIAGIKGPPTPEGLIEIGYALLAAYHRQGYGTEVVRGLIDWAFAHRRVKWIVAETYPHLLASRRVLEKNGFSEQGKGLEEGTLRFELSRQAYAKWTKTRPPETPEIP